MCRLDDDEYLQYMPRGAAEVFSATHALRGSEHCNRKAYFVIGQLQPPTNTIGQLQPDEYDEKHTRSTSFSVFSVGVTRRSIIHSAVIFILSSSKLVASQLPERLRPLGVTPTPRRYLLYSPADYYLSLRGVSAARLRLLRGDASHKTENIGRVRISLARKTPF